MLSIEQCRRLLPSGRYTDEEVEKIRDSLRQLATVLVDEYLNSKCVKKDCGNAGD